MDDYDPYDGLTREQYLQDLADEYDAPLGIVKMLADLLGPSEDFDGLVTTLNDEYG